MRLIIAIAVLWAFGLLGLVIAFVQSYYSLFKHSESIPAFPGIPTTTMAAAALKFITLPAARKHTATVIFLHVGTASPGYHDDATCQLICTGLR